MSIKSLSPGSEKQVEKMLSALDPWDIKVPIFELKGNVKGIALNQG